MYPRPVRLWYPRYTQVPGSPKVPRTRVPGSKNPQSPVLDFTMESRVRQYPDVVTRWPENKFAGLTLVQAALHEPVTLEKSGGQVWPKSARKPIPDHPELKTAP
jgi:hypothetical protein